MRWSALSVCVCLLCASGCGTQDDCTDADGDGYGAGCEAGPDCDDSDPERQQQCESEQGVDCDLDEYGQGCPCLRGTSNPCYPAPEATEGVGPCQAGVQRCLAGRWSACDGLVRPQFESCNGEDDDCDGRVDEAALSPCGGCNSDCIGGVWGPPSEPFEAGDGLAVTAAGELTLARERSERVTVWVPNTAEGTVSKIDAVQAVELARYLTGAASPERVAVDYRGDAFVLHRATTGVATLTKLAGADERCVDADADGLVTSSGPDDVLPFGQDECVLFHVPLGQAGDFAQSLSVDGTRAPDASLGGHLWVGLHDAQRLLQVDGRDGQVLREIDLEGISPYASTFDPWGDLWVVDREGTLVRVQLALPEPQLSIIPAQLACYALEALASDADGQLSLSGFSCENVIHYDPREDRWTDTRTEALRTTRGVDVLGQDTWVAHTAGELSRVRRDPWSVAQTLSLATDDFAPLESIATSADSLGQVWVVSTFGTPNSMAGVATRVDAERGEVTAQVPVGLGPRGQGDLTGNQLLGGFVPEASAARVFEGCGHESLDPDAELADRPTDWGEVHVAWVNGAGASLRVQARHAPSAGELDALPWQELGRLPEAQPPFATDFPLGGVVELRLTLATDNQLGAPRVSRVGIEWRCPGPD